MSTAQPNASSFLNFVGGGSGAETTPAPRTGNYKNVAPPASTATHQARDFLGLGGQQPRSPSKPAPPTGNYDIDQLQAELRKANADKAALSDEIDRLRTENKQLKASGGGDRAAAAERQRADELHKELVRLRDLFSTEKRACAPSEPHACHLTSLPHAPTSQASDMAAALTLSRPLAGAQASSKISCSGARACPNRRSIGVCTRHRLRSAAASRRTMTAR